MFSVESYKGTREENYQLLIKQLSALLAGETNSIANLSNASALLNQFLERTNWVGFYLMEEGELVLGPFQGLPACVRIPLARACAEQLQSKWKLSVLKMSINSLDISPVTLLHSPKSSFRL